MTLTDDLPAAAISRLLWLCRWGWVGAASIGHEAPTYGCDRLLMTGARVTHVAFPFTTSSHRRGLLGRRPAKDHMSEGRQ
jgi:hypothetical protein